MSGEPFFCPIACIISADDLDEAIYVAGDVSYGLSSGIVTKWIQKFERFQNESRAGFISVNCSPAVSELHAPFGGVKASSYAHREQGPRGLDFYTEIKYSLRLHGVKIGN